MQARQVLILVGILVGLVVTVVASLLAGVEGCAAPTDECVRAMVAKLRSEGWLGIETEAVDGTTVTVVAVAPGSPAEAAGFAVGDVLMTVDGTDIHHKGKGEPRAAEPAPRPGSVVVYTVARAGTRVTLRAQLSAPPEDLIARLVGEHVIARQARVALPSR